MQHVEMKKCKMATKFLLEKSEGTSTFWRPRLRWQNTKKNLAGPRYENVDRMKLLRHAGQVLQRHYFACDKDMFLFRGLAAEISWLLFGV
jgi:hypothetical protein